MDDHLRMLLRTRRLVDDCLARAVDAAMCDGACIWNDPYILRQVQSAQALIAATLVELMPPAEPAATVAAGKK